MMLYSSAAGNAQVGVYSTNGTLPVNLLGETATQYCAIGWNTISMTTLDLAPGNYWLAVDTDTTGVSVSTSPGSKNAEGWNFGTLPAVFSGAMGFYPYNMSVVALYYCY